MKETLENALENISNNPKNRILKEKGKIKVLYCSDDTCEGDVSPTPLLTIDPHRKYVEFHVLSGPKYILRKELRELFNYLKENNYSSNFEYIKNP